MNQVLTKILDAWHQTSTLEFKKEWSEFEFHNNSDAEIYTIKLTCKINVPNDNLKQCEISILFHVHDRVIPNSILTSKNDVFRLNQELKKMNLLGEEFKKNCFKNGL